MKLQYLTTTTNIFKVFLINIIFLCIYTEVNAQDIQTNSLSKSSFYVDAGGHFAGQFSLNLEKLIYSGPKATWYGRGGIGGAGIIMANGGFGGIAATTLLTGKQNNHFEMNLGTFVGYDNEQNNMFVYPLIDFGYRYQKPEGGFLFKAKLGFLGLGIGLGYAF